MKQAFILSEWLILFIILIMIIVIVTDVCYWLNTHFLQIIRIHQFYAADVNPILLHIPSDFLSFCYNKMHISLACAILQMHVCSLHGICIHKLGHTSFCRLQHVKSFIPCMFYNIRSSAQCAPLTIWRIRRRHGAKIRACRRQWEARCTNNRWLKMQNTTNIHNTWKFATF